MGITGYLSIGLVVLFLIMGGSIWYYKNSYESMIADNAKISQQLDIVNQTLENNKLQLKELAEKQIILGNSIDAIRKNSIKERQRINELDLSKKTIPDNSEAEKQANKEIEQSLRLGVTK